MTDGKYLIEDVILQELRKLEGFVRHEAGMVHFNGGWIDVGKIAQAVWDAQDLRYHASRWKLR